MASGHGRPSRCLFQLAEPLLGNRDRLRRLRPEDDAAVSLAEFVRHAVEAMLSWAANVRLVQSDGLFVLTYRVEEGKQRIDGASAESDVVVDAERPAGVGQ